MKRIRFELNVLMLHVEKMQSLKLSFVLFATLMSVYSAPEFEQRKKVLQECADTNGFKLDNKQVIQDLEKIRKGNTNMETVDLPEEFLCTEKCVLEKVGVLENGKFNIEKAKDDMSMMSIPADKIESYLNCLKGIQVTNCEDMKKLLKCRIN